MSYLNSGSCLSYLFVFITLSAPSIITHEQSVCFVVFVYVYIVHFILIFRRIPCIAHVGRNHTTSGTLPTVQE
ncbi:hypothetical protein V1525DRAFT_397868 [Lipomyces kononenkoae]|uniref:Uncharacterized protein n=1 Tax=Lipomyces kononenkoae TaxID=34357 RepID=A0ACC3T6K6_LIPKO